MLRPASRDTETQNVRQLENIAQRAGINGLAVGYDLHMYDVLNIAKKAWGYVAKPTIASCCMKANCPLARKNAYLKRIYRKMCDASLIDVEVPEVMEMLQNLKIEKMPQTQVLCKWTLRYHVMICINRFSLRVKSIFPLSYLFNN